MKILGVLVLLSGLVGCSSADKKLVMDGGVAASTYKCGTESYLNRYATYRCQSLELEDNNDYINQSTPIHNVKGVVVRRQQSLLVIDEKIFGAQLREKDQEVICNRRLQVVLNPGVGPSKAYQKGWLSYRPKCFSFKKAKPNVQKTIKGPLFSRQLKKNSTEYPNGSQYQ